MNKLLELRNKLKLKKPTFIRHDAHKKARVGSKWRRPKGRQNKMRLHMKGYSRGRSSGFGSPVAVRGLSRNGFVENIVASMKDFEGLDPKKDGIVFSRTLGLKKKTVLAEEAVKKGFTLLNANDKKIQEKADAIIKAKKANRSVIEKRKESKAKLAKKTSEKASKEKEANNKEDVSEEQKKEQEKKEHDKLLVQKGDSQ